MRRPPAARAADAAGALDAFLWHEQRRSRGPGPEGVTPAAAPVPPPPRPVHKPPAQEVAAQDVPVRDVPARLAHIDWLHHHLAVAGSAEMLERFAAASCGAGVIPWQLDLPTLEEDWFHRLVDPAGRSLSFTGARILAGQLRDVVERRHALAVSRVGRSRACPFDLQALLPVPPGILRLGPGHPGALAWLWENWGTTDALRRVSAGDRGEGRQAPPGLCFEFWSADWSPWRALLHLRATWPALRFDLQPSYA